MVDQLDLDAFMRQGLEYTEEGSGLERLTRLLHRPRRHAPAAGAPHARADEVGPLGRVRPHRRRRLPAPRRAGRRARRRRRGRLLLRRALPQGVPRSRRRSRLAGRPARRLAAPRPAATTTPSRTQFKLGSSGATASPRSHQIADVATHELPPAHALLRPRRPRRRRSGRARAAVIARSSSSSSTVAMLSDRLCGRDP